MKKLFIKLSMILCVLGMSTTAWAGGSIEIPQEMIATLTSQTYCAQLTGHASSTGGGKVYVNAPQVGESASDDPREGEYVEGTSNVAVSGMGVSIAGMTKIGINAWAKADPGYWFAGFSYSNMGTDLGTTNTDMPGLYANTYDIGIQPNETIEHVIYGTFEPIRIAGYEITGNATTHDDDNGNMVCNLAVIFTLSGAEVDIDASDFKTPVVSGAGWSLTSWDYNTTNAGKVTVNVRFTTTSTEVAEYAGSLKLETQATPAISMNVPLNVRTAASSNIEAIRYDKNKEKQGEGMLADMIAAASPTDVIKLNKNHNSAVTINKSFTLDLNGYDMIVNGTALTITNNATLTLAYSPYNDTDHGRIIGINQDGQCIYVESGSKLILNGTSIFNANNAIVVAAGAELVQNGANIAGANNAIYSQGTVTTTDGNVKGRVCSVGLDANLTINGGAFDNMQETINAVLFQTGVAIKVDGGTALIKKGNIIGQSYGVQSAGTTTIEKLAYIQGTNYAALGVTGGKTTVKCGKFADPSVLSNVDGGVFEFQSAYFQEDNMGVEDVEGKKLWRNTSGAEYREGYVLFAGDLAAAQAAGVSVCHIGGTSYTKLEDAFAFANNTSEKVVIIMDNDYILPAGYYTLPSTATLLIPKSNEQGASSAYVERYNSQTVPSMFRKLTFENGANLDVFGIIEVGGTQFTGSDSHTGATTGDYGQLQMNAGSRMTLQNGSILRAWGYITGDIENKNDVTYEVPMGEIDVRRGAKVYELFQMGDWGNTVMNAVGLVTGDTRFPVNSYFVQNVEVPAKYHPGAKLFAQTSVSAGGKITMCANEIPMIGVSLQDVAVFLMNDEADAENTWVRKWYDASKDQQVYEINSGAHIGSLVINLASSPLFEGMEDNIADWLNMPNLNNLIPDEAHFEKDIIMNSGQYVLPITYNFKLHLLSGTLDFTQNTELIPGSELEIDKEARVFVTDQHREDVLEGSLYIWDYQDWAKNPTKVAYSPVFGGEPTTREVDDLYHVGSAKVNVHGTFDTSVGYIFTSENGGNIFSSTEDAGTFMFADTLAKPADYYEEVKISTSETAKCYSAYLRNSDEYVAAMRAQYAVSEEEAEATYRYVKTGGTAKGKSYCYIDMGNGGEWTRLEQRGCVTYNAADGKCYIKPQEYVEIAVSDSTWNAEDAEWIVFKGNEDHTFSDAAGAGRLFINLGNPYDASSCQWWEVEQKDNYYHCIHPDNDTYYYWDESEEIWKEVKFTITWKDKNWENNPTEDVVLQSYTVPYGTQAEWLSNSPTRPSNIDYTYDFTGWSPALDKVTSDVTYTATYEEKQIKYTITFVQDGGMEIERHLLARNEMPVCENGPTRTGYILQWEPALAAVTHDTTYVATWLPEPPTEFAIRFVDYDGKTELQSGNVAVGTMPTPPAIVDGKPQKEDESFGGKPATAEYTYVFDHWSPAVTEVTQAMTYVAVYREVAVLYSVRFEDEDGNEIETNAYAYGETPVCSSIPTKTNTAQYTYSFAWTPQIQTVTGDATYRAVFTPTTNKYTVSVKSNPSGACAISGAGIYDYNTSDTAVTITITPNSGYTFTGWSDGQGGTNTTRQMAITDTIELVANFTVADPDWTITWKSEDGENTLATVGQKTNTATIFTGATPTKAGNDQYSYVFDGWTTAPNNGGTFYKNNMTPKATGNATYYAHFDSVVNQYTVYWKNEAGTANIEMDIDQPYGAEVAYNSATPTKSATVGATYVFDGWSTSVGGDVVSLPATVKGEAIYYAHFAAVARTYTVTWLNDEGGMIDQTTVNYGDDPTHANPTKEGYTFTGWTPALEPVTGEGAIYQAVFTPIVANLEIGVGESEDLDHADVERTNLVITSNGVDASGQLLGAEHLSITGEAIFRLEQDFDAETWYAVAVPWTVALSGIRDNDGNAFASGNVYVIEFDASAYASADRDLGRTDYWKFLDETGNDMQPGKLYMIWFKYEQTTAVEFHKKDGASLWTTSTSVALANGSVENQRNWNAIANPALYYADMATGAADGDVLKYNGNDAYMVASSTNMVVGQPIFAQVSTASTVAAEPVGGGAGMPAYRRAPQTATEANNRFVVELTHNGKLADRLIVQTAEEKANEYVIGKDLSKMSVSTKVAQMWMERYNTKLCKNTVEMNGEAVNYPLVISAPVAGEYIISNANVNANAGYALYLTQNGVVIANLSEGDYTLYLNGGTTHEYGLRIGARAPQTATCVDEAVVDAQGEIKKVLIDNKVYIIRGNNVYTVDGQMVK